MDEYISREELLKHLNECRNDPLFDPDMARICFAISIFVENMKSADVQPVKQWVKLHDKHPDTEGLYLVCDQYGECEVVEYLPDIKSWFTHKINGEIRYWMPLPKPPKDGDDDETL